MNRDAASAFGTTASTEVSELHLHVATLLSRRADWRLFGQFALTRMNEDTDVCAPLLARALHREGCLEGALSSLDLGHSRERVAFLGGRASWRRNQTSRVPKSVPHEASSIGQCASCLSDVGYPSPPFRARKETTVFLACRRVILRRCAPHSKWRDRVSRSDRL